jgi:hypothetical protein
MPVTPTSRAAAGLDRARALRVALERLAVALARGDAAAVLAAEPLLQAALEVGSPDDLAAPEDRAAVAADLAAARAALARCRAVGAASAELTGVTLDVLGRTGSYGRHGAGQPRGPRGRDLHARV